MRFLFPAFLLGALAVAIPIALHFFRRDVAPEVPFTAVRLLHRSPIERSRRRRLRDLVLLAARVAALLLLAFAFARPYIAGATGSVSTLRIVAIDRSYSMGGPGRFERALALARTAIDEAAAGERVAVIAFDDRAELLREPGSAAEAKAALSGLAPGYGATRFAPVLARASDTAQGGQATLVVVSDLQRSAWEDEGRATMPASLTLELRDVGAAERNAAVSSVRADGDRLLVGIRNSGPAQRGQIIVTRDSRRVATVPYEAAADAALDVAVPYRAPASGSLEVTIDDPGGFDADNTRYVILGRSSRAAVLVLTNSGAAESAFYLMRALDAAGDGDGAGFEATLARGATLAAMTPADLERIQAVIVLSTRGLDRRARENIGAMVRRGAGALVAAAPDVEPAVLSGIFDWKPPLQAGEQALSGGTLAATDLRHPIFRPFGPLAANLGQVRFERAWRVRSDGWDVAARFTDATPALLERASGDGRVVLFASDFDRRWNDFPLHPAFVPFAVEAVRYVAGARDDTSDYTVARAPRGIPARPGIYQAEPGNRPVVVNVDPREGGVARLTASEFDGMIDRVGDLPSRAGMRAQQAEASQGYWRYGLLLMIAALVGESVVGRA